MTKSKATGSAAGRGFSRDGDLAVQDVDRVQEAAGTQAKGVLEAEDNALLCEFLDGACYAGKFGRLAETAERFLWVPNAVTKSPVAALLLCRQVGLLREKVDRLSPEARDYLFNSIILPSTFEN